MNRHLQSRFAGCLVGAATGDSLGMGYVGCTAADIQARGGGKEFMPGDISAVTVVVPIGELGESEIGHALSSGQWTEDTQLTIALAKSLIEEGGVFVPESWTHALVRWINDEPRLPGISTLQAAMQLRTAGVFWDEAADPEGAGSGPAARVAPIALVYCGDPDAAERRKCAVLQTQITHGHPDARAAALAMSEAIATLINMPELDAAGWNGVNFLRSIHDVVSTASPHYEEFARCLTLATNLLIDNVDRADAVRVLGTSGWCREAVPCALYLVASAPESAETLISDAVRLTGGATDTIACMTGALAGALHGIEALPKRWTSQLEACDELSTLAESLLRLRMRRR